MERSTDALRYFWQARRAVDDPNAAPDYPQTGDLLELEGSLDVTSLRRPVSQAGDVAVRREGPAARTQNATAQRRRSPARPNRERTRASTAYDKRDEVWACCPLPHGGAMPTLSSHQMKRATSLSPRSVRVCFACHGQEAWCTQLTTDGARAQPSAPSSALTPPPDMPPGPVPRHIASTCAPGPDPLPGEHERRGDLGLDDGIAVGDTRPNSKSESIRPRTY